MLVCNFSRIDGDKFDALYLEGGIGNVAPSVKRGGSMESALVAFAHYDAEKNNILLRIEEASATGSNLKKGSDSSDSPRSIVVLMGDEELREIWNAIPDSRKQVLTTGT